ncbi:hypothetical protein GCM10011386_22580 [Parapedobacter defluvii]|uniref:Uncharacterized protein n=1 Tax=Parapedobacter defluvii TaxID=2045106 RepID=A0ABQ1LW14_9SPHI|nr:glycosyltransferase [Parapedobacter defluvii]GGC30039.1 hypothetical protein GCM10011386_22580 [Parapedobacter defluvii]
MQGENIVIVGQQPWDTELGSNCKDIAIEFSRKNRVLYVNSPLDRYTSLYHRRQPYVRRRLNVVCGKESGFSQINENLWVLYPDCIVESINWIELWSLFNLINKLNNKRFAKAIKKYLKELNFDKFILFNDNEILKCRYLKEYLNPEVAVYYSRDFILAAPYWSKRAAALEPDIIRKNDLCVANSMYLTNYCKQYNPNSHYIGQGFNLELFNDVDQTRPSDIKSITGKIIGYVGVLHSSRLDIETLAYIASSRPEWKLVLVGPEDQGFKQSVLHKAPNIIFLGMKKGNELPKYINAFDVCINPQFLTPLTIGNYPRKIDEYLIMGKPVVALLTHAMEIFSEVTYLAKNKEEYVDFIELAMKEDCEELRNKRKAIAQSHSWENSVNAIYSAIQEVKETL